MRAAAGPNRPRRPTHNAPAGPGPRGMGFRGHDPRGIVDTFLTEIKRQCTDFVRQRPSSLSRDGTGARVCSISFRHPILPGFAITPRIESKGSPGHPDRLPAESAIQHRRQLRHHLRHRPRVFAKQSAVAGWLASTPNRTGWSLTGASQGRRWLRRVTCQFRTSTVVR
jgi:hypothetical protein